MNLICRHKNHIFNLAIAMNRWINHHFSRKSRAKCLILIGATGTGNNQFQHNNRINQTKSFYSIYYLKYY